MSNRDIRRPLLASIFWTLVAIAAWSVIFWIIDICMHGKFLG